MKKIILIFFILISCLVFADEDVFKISAELIKADNNTLLNVKVIIPKEHYIYSEKFKVLSQNENIKLTPNKMPTIVNIKDNFLEKNISAYIESFEINYRIEMSNNNDDLNIIVALQGCNHETCFLPEKKYFNFSTTSDSNSNTNNKNVSKITIENNEIVELLDHFEIKGQIAGYLNPKKFLKKLNEIELSKTNEQNAFESTHSILTFLIILLGGLALNLTPCVLPMIPINLAIMGAGAKASSKTKGFLLGLSYAFGMAISYGTLGAIVVLTGMTFGSLNASPYFNFSISFLFFILAAGMAGIFNIDFSKFRTSSKANLKAPYILVFFMGAVSSLLAGACVAPVVLSVLLLSGKLYSEGNSLSIFLPFVLGIGMGLPWPFLGAGLSFLPKPGNWMEKIKKFFAFLILVFAIYYAKLGFDLLNITTLKKEINTNNLKTITDSEWNNNLLLGLKESLKTQKPVIIDFWATWCKNCTAMDKITFKDKNVKDKLDSNYVKIKFQAENPSDIEIKKILDFFNVKGLPTIIIMNEKHN